MPIEMQDVESSNLAQVGYDPEAQLLAVTFKDKDGNASDPWHYPNVPPADHAALMNADSIGSHFARNIRNVYTAIAPTKDGS